MPGQRGPVQPLCLPLRHKFLLGGGQRVARIFIGNNVEPHRRVRICQIILDIKPEITLNQWVEQAVVEKDGDWGLLRHGVLSSQEIRVPRGPSACAMRSIWCGYVFSCANARRCATRAVLFHTAGSAEIAAKRCAKSARSEAISIRSGR